MTAGAALCLCFSAAAAQPPSAETVRGLGTLSFPTSAHSPAAQTAFVRGVLLLHLFEYPEAAAAFRDAEHLDPSLALAYWGEAMTFTHAVWDEQDVPGGRAALAKLAPTAGARDAKATTARERSFLHAVDILYGDGPKARRDTLYSLAMAELLHAYPHDDEARLFYALSLLGLSQGVRDVPTYVIGAAIAESVFVRNPQNPGAAHYWIHGTDDPDHAGGALPAARALSRIAPDADHAQHMTSHIFMARGMWDDVVPANENAMRVVDAMRASHGRSPSYCGHYNAWLEYGYLQQGRLRDARRLLEHCRDQARASAPRRPPSDLDPDDAALASYAQMWTRYLLDTRDWSGAVATWTIDSSADPAVRLAYQFTRGYAAVQRGDLSAARSALHSYDDDARILDAAAPTVLDPETAEFERRERVLRLELQALVWSRSVTPDSGLPLLAAATALEDSMAYAFGPPYVDKPAHELRGELLLGVTRLTEAEREFTVTLQRTPHRTAALLGLARAQAGAGEAVAAAGTRAELLAIWHGADSGVTAGLSSLASH